MQRYLCLGRYLSTYCNLIDCAWIFKLLYQVILGQHMTVVRVIQMQSSMIKLFARRFDLDQLLISKFILAQLLNAQYLSKWIMFFAQVKVFPSGSNLSFTSLRSNHWTKPLSCSHNKYQLCSCSVSWANNLFQVLTLLLLLLLSTSYKILFLNSKGVLCLFAHGRLKIHCSRRTLFQTDVVNQDQLLAFERRLFLLSLTPKKCS